MRITRAPFGALLATIGIALSLTAALARAQAVRGVVVGQGDVPVPGVVVMLLDSASGVAARALSDERGEFRVVARRAGTYRVRTLRIGFRPVVSEPFALAAGQEVARRIELANVPVALEAVRVAGKSACGAMGDSAAATFAVWEQVRAALTATQLTASARAISATTVSYDRTLDRDFRRVLDQNATISTAYVTQPWRALAPDSLRRIGYVVTDADNATTYYAPGLDVLLSTTFLEDHCFRLVAAPPPDTSRVGIAFEPTRDRRGVAEIRGTVWIDRKSSELEALEYGYTNLPRPQEEHAGGAMEFARMTNGGWVISRWSIRMPAFAEPEPAARGAARGASPVEPRVAEVRVTGGELVAATRGRDTLWARAPLVLAGTVADSLTGAPVPLARVALVGTRAEGATDAAGRFAIAGVPPGEYTLEVHTPLLDSLGAVHRSTLTFADSAASIQVRIPPIKRVARAAAFTGVVFADSSDRPVVGAEVSFPELSKSALTDDRGAFRITDIPAGPQRVVVRRIGYGPLDTRVEFPAGKTVDRRIYLPHVVALDSVRVTGERPVIASFEEHRKLGLGHFLTRDDLAKLEGRKLSQALEQMAGVELVVGQSSHAWIATRRGLRTLQNPPGIDKSDVVMGARRSACYAQVWLDRVLVYSGRRPNESLFDINSIAPEQVEAIEYYAGPAQTPGEYSEMGSQCGVVVIHTRRSP